MGKSVLLSRSFFLGRFSVNKLFFIFLLFTLACCVKWFYLHQQDYYIAFYHILPGSYSTAEASTWGQLLSEPFTSWGWTVSARGPIPGLIYSVALKLSNFHTYTAFYLGVLLGSLLIPAYYLVVSKLFNSKVALFSSLIIIFMTTYIEMSLILTTILPGVIFLLFALLLAIKYYKDGGHWCRLYLSALFLTMGVFCRYEYALFIPFFILYNLRFDQRARFHQKFIYWILSASSALIILLGNYIETGNTCSFIYGQWIDMLGQEGYPAVGFFRALFISWQILQRLLPWPLWVLGLIGVFFVIRSRDYKALFILASIFTFFGFLVYKIQNGTIFYNEMYFFVCPLTFIPLSLDSIAASLSRLFKKRILVTFFLIGITIFLIGKFNRANLAWKSFYFSQQSMKITEDLKQNFKNDILYVSREVDMDSGGEAQSMLYYLGRNPMKYFYEYNAWKREGGPFLLLCRKDTIAQKVKGKKISLVRDYDYLGLYRISD